VGHGAAGGYTHRQVLKILSGLLMAMITAVISTSVTTIALPTIMGELGGQEQLAWVASAPLLAMTASTPLWGRLSDIFGRKRMYQTALLLFTASSIAAGLSQNVGQLIAFRALQGMGAGGAMALTQVILGDIVEPRQRGRYSGYLGAAYGLSTVTAPLLGGFLVDAPRLGWRWCFFVTVPLALAALAITQWTLHRPPRETGRARPKIDWAGAVTITGAASTALIVLSLGGKEFPWNSPWTYGLTALTLVLLGAAVAAERRAAAPILPPRLFADRTFVLASAASLMVGVGMFGVMTYLPQYLQVVQGMTPTVSGLLALPMTIGVLLGSTVSGQVAARTGRWKMFPVTGTALLAAGMFLLSRLQVDSGPVAVGIGCGTAGLGLGMTMTMLVLATQNAADRADMAAATSGVTFFRSMGGAVGVAALGAVLTARLTAALTERLRAARLPVPERVGTGLGTPEEIHALPEPLRGLLLASFTEAVQAAFLVGVPIALAGLAAALALKELPLRTSSAPAEDRRPPAAAAPPADAGRAAGAVSHRRT